MMKHAKNMRQIELRNKYAECPSQVEAAVYGNGQLPDQPDLLQLQ